MIVIPFYILKIEYGLAEARFGLHPYMYIIPLFISKVKENLLVFVTSGREDPWEIGRIP